MTQGSGGSTAPRPHPVVCHPQPPPPVRRRGVMPIGSGPSSRAPVPAAPVPIWDGPG